MAQGETPRLQTLRMADDPLAGRQRDAPIPIQLVEPGFLPTGGVPQGVRNWDYYDGAIVTVGISDGEIYTVYGSGVMVAPGLILTATHVVRDFVEEIEAKRLSLYCIGMRQSGFADVWALRSMSFAEDESDVAFLGVELNSQIAEGLGRLVPTDQHEGSRGRRAIDDRRLPI